MKKWLVFIVAVIFAVACAGKPGSGPRDEQARNNDRMSYWQKPIDAMHAATLKELQNVRPGLRFHELVVARVAPGSPAPACVGSASFKSTGPSLAICQGSDDGGKRRVLLLVPEQHLREQLQKSLTEVGEAAAYQRLVLVLAFFYAQHLLQEAQVAQLPIASLVVKDSQAAHLCLTALKAIDAGEDLQNHYAPRAGFADPYADVLDWLSPFTGLPKPPRVEDIAALRHGFEMQAPRSMLACA